MNGSSHARGVADLSTRTKLRITGTDRVRYLNGQISNDLRKLESQRTLYACVMTAKGRMCADIFVQQTPDALLIDAAAELAETLLARLERYIVADDVVIEDVTSSFHLFHILGRSGILPGAVASTRFGVEGADLWAPLAAADETWKSLADHLGVLSEEACEALRIEQGVPAWGAELDENTLPPEAGLDRTAIDYHKGCYLGQEIISRLKSVGHVNRMLHRLAASVPPGEPSAFQAGAALVSDQNRPAGAITSATWSFALSERIALGYLKRGMENLPLMARVEGHPDVPVRVSPLPLPTQT